MSFRKAVSNEKGQMILEYILLSVVAAGIATLIHSSFKENEILGTLIAGPWVNLSGMIQNGSWGDPSATIKNHPNHHSNSASLVGEKTK